jgi:arylsulfatase A-like enzyme
LLVSLALLLGCGATPSDPINVLLLTVDTLRADHLSAYGYARQTSPAIDRLAEQGVLFQHAIVQRGGTWPSLTSILSLYPYTHGVRRNGDQLDASKKILAELLRERGYRTAAFLANMMSAPNRGFDHKPKLEKPRDRAATGASIEWLRAHADGPFFLWVHLMGPHDPYAPRKEFRSRFDTGYRGRLGGDRKTLVGIYRNRQRLSPAELAHIVSLYDGDIAEVDQRIGSILATLDELGLADSTLVVFASDHGEELYDHHYYFLHSESIYDSVLRVPLILRLPGRIPAGDVVAAPVESIDIAPTILELVGAPIPQAFEGKSLVDRIGTRPTRPASGQEDAAYSELVPGVYSVRTQRWHYIYNALKDDSLESRRPAHWKSRRVAVELEELYDIIRDPAETTNLAADNPVTADSLRERLWSWIRRGDRDYQPQDLQPEVQEELRALGYIQ